MTTIDQTSMPGIDQSNFRVFCVFLCGPILDDFSGPNSGCEAIGN